VNDRLSISVLNVIESVQYCVNHFDERTVLGGEKILACRFWLSTLSLVIPRRMRHVKKILELHEFWVRRFLSEKMYSICRDRRICSKSGYATALRGCSTCRSLGDEKAGCLDNFNGYIQADWHDVLERDETADTVV